jgi:GntR family transcriptional regulator
MARAVEIDPADPAPIWRQIEEQVRRLVATGVLAPGAPVPSVRELSKSLRVNPATVAKAYQRLVDAGVLAVRRGEGTYVADAPPAMSAAERRRGLRDGAERYGALAMSLGAGLDDAGAELRAAWSSLERDAKGASS